MKVQRRPHRKGYSSLYARDLDKKKCQRQKIDSFLVSWRADARASGGTVISIFLIVEFFLSGPGYLFMYTSIYFLKY